MTTFAIFLFEGAEELDWAGPWEVLSTWANGWPDEAQVFTVAREPGPVRCAKGLRVIADHTWDSMPEAIDVLVYPGGRGNRAQIGDEVYRSWVRGFAARGVLMTSVCTGALVYADAGLLDGRAATTHWASLEHLEKLGTDIQVRPHDRFVDEGDIITAQGVSAGIDMALHLIVRFASAERAREVRRYIQYDPAPPV